MQKKNSKKEKELEKFLKTLPPEIVSTLGIVIAFSVANMIYHFALPRKNLTKTKKIS